MPKYKKEKTNEFRKMLKENYRQKNAVNIAIKTIELKKNKNYDIE